MSDFGQLIESRIQSLLAFFAENYHWFWDSIEILLVTALLYGLLILVHSTRATPVLIGILALIGLRLLADFFQFLTLLWILDTFFSWFPVILVILFADDLRRALGRLGRNFLPRLSEHQESKLIGEVVHAAQALAKKQIGALIVLEREAALDDHIESGQAIDAQVSEELLSTLFLPESPLHDGAVLIQHGRITRVGAILPLTLRSDLPVGVGTRHRAAVGIGDLTDAAVVVVSEETGALSAVLGDEFVPGIAADALLETLRDYLARGRAEGDEEEAAPEAAPEAIAPAKVLGAERGSR